MGKRFSAWLVEDGLVSTAQMEEALQRQAIFGGRLGTNLLEMGLINEPSLVQYLSRAKIVPAATLTQLSGIDPDALRLLDVDTVERLRLMPLRLYGNGAADVLVEDPLSARLIAEFNDMTGYTFTPFIAPEFRFAQCLQVFYGRPMPQRHARLLAQYPLAVGLGQPSGLGMQRAAGGELARSNQGRSASEYRRERQLGFGWSQSEATLFLRELYCRDTTLELLLGYAGNFALRRVLLVVMRDRLQGFGSAGLGRVDADVREVRMPLTKGGPLEEVRHGSTYFKGHPSEAGLQTIYEQLDVSVPPHAVLLPIPVGPRAGLMLLLDDERLKIDIDTLAPLFLTITEVTSTLERIIKLSKRDELPPEGLRIPAIPERHRHSQHFGRRRDEEGVSGGALPAVPAPAEAAPSSPLPSVPALAVSAELPRRPNSGAALRARVAPVSAARAAASEARAAASEPRAVEPEPRPAPETRPLPGTPVLLSALHVAVPAPGEAAPAAPSLPGAAALLDELDSGWDLSGDFSAATPSAPAAPAAVSGPRLRGAAPARSQAASVRAAADAALAHAETGPQPVLSAAPSGEEQARVAEIRNLLSLLDLDALRAEERDVFQSIMEQVDTLRTALDAGDVARAEALAADLAARITATPIHPPASPEAPEAPQARQTSNLHRVEASAAPAPRRSYQPPAQERRFVSTGRSGAVKPPAPEVEAEVPLPLKTTLESEVQPEPSGPVEVRVSPLLELESEPTQPLDTEALLAMLPPRFEATPEEAVVASQPPAELPPVEAAAPPVEAAAVEVEAEPPPDDGATQELDLAALARLEAARSAHPLPVGEPTALLDIPMELIEGDAAAARRGEPTLTPLAIEMELIEDELDPEVTAGHSGSFDPETMAALQSWRPWVQRLSAPQAEEASRAAQVLLASGGTALPALLESFPGPLRQDRYAHTVHTLPSYGEHGPLLAVLLEFGDLAAPALVGLLAMPSAEVRFYATFFFDFVRYEPAIALIFDRLFDRDGTVRDVARRILRHQRATAASIGVLGRLRREARSVSDPWRCEQAVVTLGVLADVEAVPVLIPLLDGSHRRLQEVAHRALCAIALDDHGFAARRWERWHASHAREPRHRWLIEALNHGDEAVRELAAAELRTIPGLVVNYAPQSPRPLRQRAQKVVADFYQQQGAT